VAVLSLATSGDQTAIAWTLANEGGVYIAFYDRDLRLVANLGPIGHTRGDWPVPIAATPEGWVVAIPHNFFDPGIDVIALSSCGAVTGTFALPGAVDLAFAAEPGKAPLVAWIDLASGPMVRAGRLGADGRSVPATVALFSGEFYDEGPLSATFVGDGFLVAGFTSGGVTIARVEADGTFRGTVQTPFGAHTYEARLTSDGARTEIAYFDTGGLTATMSLASLDRTGVPVGAPRPLDVTTRVLGLAVDANGRAVALTTDDLGIVLEALPLRADDTLDTPVPLGGDYKGVARGALARRGSELVAAWIGGGCEGRLHLARLAP
jgi:hypothetical protein